MTTTLHRESTTPSTSPNTIDVAVELNPIGSQESPAAEQLPWLRRGSNRAPRFGSAILTYGRNLGITIVVSLFLLVSLGDAIPASRLAETVDSRLEPMLVATGFYQQWALFSPQPLTIEVRTFAIVYFEDGTEAVWFPTDQTNNIDSTTNERWRKWEGRIREDSYSAHWPATAQFVAHRHSTVDAAVASVRLVRTWSDVPPPDTEPGDRVHYEFHFFEWDATTETGWMLGEEDQFDANID